MASLAVKGLSGLSGVIVFLMLQCVFTHKSFPQLTNCMCGTFGDIRFGNLTNTLANIQAGRLTMIMRKMIHYV